MRRIGGFNIHAHCNDTKKDLFSMFDTPRDRLEILHKKRQRLLWVMNGLYHFYLFGETLPGRDMRVKMRKFSKQCELYERHLESLKEAVRQREWDRKRERVRKRRERNGQ